MTDVVKGLTDPLDTTELGIMVRWLAHQIAEIEQHPQDPEREPGVLIGLTDAKRMLQQLQFDLEVAEEADKHLPPVDDDGYPIIVASDGRSIVSGHMRYKVARELGLPIRVETWNLRRDTDATPVPDFLDTTVDVTVDGVTKRMTFREVIALMEADFPGFTEDFSVYAKAKAAASLDDLARGRPISDPGSILDDLTEPGEKLISTVSFDASGKPVYRDVAMDGTVTEPAIQPDGSGPSVLYEIPHDMDPASILDEITEPGDRHNPTRFSRWRRYGRVDDDRDNRFK